MARKANTMTKEDAARIQRSNAPKTNGKTEKDSFPARAQSSADKNEKKEG